MDQEKKMVDKKDILVAWFGDVNRTDVAAAGGKGASLSDMALADLPVPPGFVVCTGAFRRFLTETELDKEILAALTDIDVEKTAVLETASLQITEKIESQILSDDLTQAIMEAYQRLCAEGGLPAVEVAVRSSAAAEDSGAASFAGQQETYLNIFGHEQVIDRVRACWGSFFKPRALYYRRLKGSLEDLDVAVVIQRMVNPDKSGVLFTVDPVQRRRDRVMIEAAWGLGEAVVSGEVTPDNYIVNKEDGSLVSKFVPRKNFMIVREESGVGVRRVALPDEKSSAQVLSMDEIAKLTELGARIEAHFGSPQDVEWAIQGDKLYILQSRPVTTL
jgi:pyruvate,water dikinase